LENFFITGATGFIGKHLIKAIDGNIKILSRSPLKDYESVICELGVELIPKDALNNIQTIIHLAGVAHNKFNDKNTDLYYKVNIDATIELANLAVKSGVKNFVFISSVKAGGRSFDGSRVNEQDHFEPEGIYGKTKREAELRLLEISKISGMNITIIRPSLVCGPNVKGNLKKMFQGIKSGWFPPLPETNNKKSIIHVDDLVQAILLVLKDNRTNGEIYIATDDVSYSSRNIYTIMCKLAGKPIPKWTVPKLFFDILGLFSPNIKYKVDKLLGDEYYSSGKLKKLGFRPQKTLENMNETIF